MITEPESAVRAKDEVIARALESIIAKTRRHWSERPERRLATGTARRTARTLPMPRRRG